jgi:hypothetical protein
MAVSGRNDDAACGAIMSPLDRGVNRSELYFQIAYAVCPPSITIACPVTQEATSKSGCQRSIGVPASFEQCGYHDPSNPIRPQSEELHAGIE